MDTPDKNQLEGQVVPEEEEIPSPNSPRYQAIIRQIEEQQAAYDTALKYKATASLYIFNKYVLEVEKGKQELALFHKNLCRFVTDDMKKKKLILVPRGHLKSTLVTIGYSTQRIVKDPNVRILILSATWQMGVDFLTEIKNNLTKNETLQRIFPVNTQNAPEWGKDRITLDRTNTNIKGPTVWATGIESNLVGSHPDLIILDDVVNRDNVNTREQIEKVILRYKDCLDLLEPGGQLIVIGTRWSQEDFYGWLMDKDAKILSSYDVLRQEAYTGDLMSDSDEDLKLLWPEKFNRKILRDLLREKGWYEFSAQYRNDPIPQEDATFKRTYFQYFDMEDTRGKLMNKVMLVDPAISLEKEADFSAIVVVGIDQFRNIYILDIWRGKVRPRELITKIFEKNSEWYPKTVGIETIAFQKALAYSLREEMQIQGKFIPIKEITSHDRSKDQRIQGLQPQYEQHRVFHRNNHDFIPYYEYELLAWPRGKNDDMIDAVSLSLDFLIPPRPKQKRFNHEYLY